MPNLEYSEWIDTISLFLTISGIFIGLIYTQLLQSPDDRQDVVAFFRRGYVRGFYQGGITFLLNWLESFYGKKESSRAFNASLLMAYLYPFLFFIFGYGYSDGANQFSNVILLPDEDEHRFWLFPALFLLVIFSFFVVLFILNESDGFDSWVHRQLRQVGFSRGSLVYWGAIIVGLATSLVLWSQAQIEIWRVLVGFVVGYTFVVVAFFVVNATLGALAIVAFAMALGTLSEWFLFIGPGLGIFMVATAFALIFFGAVVFADASAGAGIMSVTVMTAFFLAQEETLGVSLMWAFFYFVLPLVNALLDWLSWWVSRWFLERTAQEPKVRIIVLDVVLDFGVAILFMLALCLLLPAGAMLLDSLYAGWVDMNTGVPAQTGWQEYAVWARDDPWGKGIMVTLMLVTNLSFV